MTINLESIQKQKKTSEKFITKGKAKVDTLEKTNQNLEEAMEEVKQKLEEAYEEYN